ncbi:MAG: SPFH domain-containing protein [Clostridiales bacterium]|nr:SPFH domain-containing protein [Clostridiales bacterium]
MKGIVLEPMIADENVVIQFTDVIETDKNTTVKVPNGFIAVVFIDERVAFKLDVCVGKKLVDYGKEYIRKQCKVAFVRTKPLPQMMWGFGNIQVNNSRLKEAYRVGANGKYGIEISEMAKLIHGFYTESNITIETLREKTISIIKTVGTSVLGSYFADTDISVFEISAHTNELRNTMLNALSQESAFAEIGIRLKDLTVDGIHVNEEDMQLIRNRINE